MKIDDQYYVDGGIYQHLPVQPLRDAGLSHIIGVDVIPACKLKKIHRIIFR